MSYDVIIQGPTSDTTVQDVRVDAATHSLQVISYPHHELHAGSAFTCQYNNDVTNIGEMTAIGFNTADTTKWLHMVISASSTGGGTVAFYENPSVDNGEGTALVIYNRNRNSATLSTMTSVEASPVANKATSYNETQAAGANITTTTALMFKAIGTGGKNSVGSETRGQAEFILEQGQQYIIVMSSLTNDTVTHTITLDWYEHTDKGA